MVLSKLFSTKPLSRENHPKALSLLTLLKRGFTPTLQDFNQFLLFLSKTHKHKSIIHFFSQLNSNQIKTDAQTHTIFTKALIKEQKYEEAFEFIKTHVGNSKIWYKNWIFDALIQGICIKEKNPERALSVLQESLSLDGILPSSFTFCALIYSFSSNGMMDKAIEVLELMADEKVNYPFDNFVYSSVISGFVRIGKPELAIGFYENAEKSGALKPNVVTYTALVSAFCRLGTIEHVSDLVSLMEKDRLAFDAVFYSNWICGYIREGMIKEALRKHREAVDRKVELDAVSYTILIDGLSKEGDVEKAVGLIYKMGKDGLEPNLVTYTVIILGFCKKGKLEEAFAVFKMVEDYGIQVDEFTYAILINGVCRKGDFDRAFQLLDEMEKKGISPSVVTYNTIINGLCKVGRTSEADDVSKGIDADVVTYGTLLHGYVEEENSMGALQIKRRLEAAGVQMDVVMCNILIKALFMLGSFEEARSFYERMPEMDLTVNSITYCTMIDGYCKAGRIDEALEIFDESRKMYNSSAACYNCIIQGLCQEGMVGMAVEVFLELMQRCLAVDRAIYMMLIRTIFTKDGSEGILSLIHKLERFGHEIADVICNEAICFLSKKGSSEAACSGLMVMTRKGSVVASKSYYLILKALLRGGKNLLTPLVLSAFIKAYGISEVRVITILVHYLCVNKVDNALKFLPKMTGNLQDISFSASVLETLIKDGRVLDAYKLVMGAETLHLDAFDFSVVIDGLGKEGHVDKALDLCAFAKKKGITLSIVAYNSVINGLCRQGCLFEALRLFDALEEINIPPSGITYATLINSLSKAGHLPDARRLVDKMLIANLEPNTRVYNSLIDGYCKFGQIQEALILLRDLEIKSLQPDEFTVSAVINGYCQKGDMEGALDFFSKFKRKGISPDFLGFLYLVRGLYAKGRMEESRGVLREMLQSPSVIDLLKKVDNEVELESAQSFLLFLCERGSIRETIAILDEVGSKFLLPGRIRGTRDGSQKLTEPDYRKVTSSIQSQTLSCTYDIDSNSKTCDDANVETIADEHVVDDRIHRSLDFDTFYSLVASLHSKGELCKVNELTRMFFGVL